MLLGPAWWTHAPRPRQRQPCRSERCPYQGAAGRAHGQFSFRVCCVSVYTETPSLESGSQPGPEGRTWPSGAPVQGAVAVHPEHPRVSSNPPGNGTLQVSSTTGWPCRAGSHSGIPAGSPWQALPCPLPHVGPPGCCFTGSRPTFLGSDKGRVGTSARGRPGGCSLWYMSRRK